MHTSFPGSGRNYYTVVFDRHGFGHDNAGWVVVYAYGSSLEDAFANGFRHSAVQPAAWAVGCGTFEAAARIAAASNAQADDALRSHLIDEDVQRLAHDDRPTLDLLAAVRTIDNRGQ